MNRALVGVIIFTVVETIGLVLWLIAAGVPFKGGYGAVAILIGFLFVEHYVSVNVGNGRPPFGSLPPNK